GVAVDRVVLRACVSNDYTLGLAVLAQAIDAAETLAKRVEARNFCHECVEVEVGTRLDTLRTDHDQLLAGRGALTTGHDTRPERLQRVVTVKGAHPAGQQ